MGTLGLVLFYASWYFLWHRHMWIRHLQPVLYLGFAFILAHAGVAASGFFARVEDFFSQVFARRTRGAVISLLLLLVFFGGAAKAIWEGANLLATAKAIPSYAFGCRGELASAACVPPGTAP